MRVRADRLIHCLYRAQPRCNHKDTLITADKNKPLLRPFLLITRANNKGARKQRHDWCLPRNTTYSTQATHTFVHGCFIFIQFSTNNMRPFPNKSSFKKTHFYYFILAPESTSTLSPCCARSCWASHYLWKLHLF